MSAPWRHARFVARIIPYTSSISNINHCDQNIMGLLQAFYMLARDYKKVYLILKCTNTVASSSQLLRSYMAELDKLELIKSHTRSSVLNRLIIYQHDLSSPKLADMYRMSDVYVAPFAAESFNLPVLEAVASGLPVIVPDQGPCVEYAHRPSTIWIPSQIDKISPLNLEDAVVPFA
jgi:glycosyltransferase involved in cell wall biosynthesis